MTDQTPQERAATAAEALAADGNPVTARAVQQRAKVDMRVAAAVARDWNAQQAEAREVPEAPAAVTTRLQGIWREAVVAARGEHEADREGWASRIQDITDERDSALGDADRERLRAEQAESELAGTKEQIAELEALVLKAQGETSAAEARAAAAEGVADGLREALAALQPGTKKK